ncbi:DUF6355 family natural product biosynthesis protein [Amycolatopsis pittospori]|uniref:DUF6355 family natural product biosynthesis protein n=1 Tax=Amycolatopsis pittospori TaxID=2749434 RepID=UPI0015F053F3|nr:DUF6355 family natural product biosynthesis protein [Amycolatopsis pittospori]
MRKPARALALAVATMATAASVSAVTVAPAAAYPCGFYAEHGQALYGHCGGATSVMLRVEVNENLAPPWIRDHDQCVAGGIIPLGDWPMIYDAWAKYSPC